MFIDFHTHSDRQDPELLNLQTLHVTPELSSEELPTFCSLGLHPWFVEEKSWAESWANLELLGRSPQVIAIGECGLDRLIPLSLEVQITIFQKQIELAEVLQKPLVIHCVRAFAELIELKKKTKPSVPWIIHGFNKKSEVLQQLLRHDFYFSFGAAILSDRSPLHQAIATIPDGKFLLETDDRHDLSVKQIYERVASLRQVSLTTLQAQLLETYYQLTRLS
ncbi:TatD family hydrolase [Pseudanabaena sp. FACHB-1998]|uniref:TatD family hydrolase n=1 Tax=Pseudanabaena sp. FACHB-1998 TaxID=2692858 RepID=UPI001680363C|nr:TatD family hydrolase [Pseudanabaena sp. FACHB-1998]MBD2175866.1 TatD family hydrolase [Pseudanabaena sp. FACHB-1998]